MTLGERIKAARKEKGITQKELADLINKGFSTVQKYEIDVIEPPISVLEKIADALNVSIQKLCGLSDELTEGQRAGKQLSLMLDLLSSDPEHEELIEAYEMLNKTGKKIAIERVEELTEIPKYTTPDEEKNPR